MSFEYYVNKWIITKTKLEKFTAIDDKWRLKSLPVNERMQANLLFGDFYAKYCMLYQELDDCLDQMVQPQKRRTVKKIVDAAAMRLLDFNNILLDLDLSEYHYIDGTLVELKLVPYDVEILHPTLFHHRPVDIEDMWTKIQKGEKIFIPPPAPESESDLIQSLLERTGQNGKPVRNVDGSPTLEATPKLEDKRTAVPAESGQVFVRKSVENKDKEEPPPPIKKAKPKQIVREENPVLSEEELIKIKRKEYITECVTLIQTAERGRQDRLYYLVKWMISEKARKAKSLAIEYEQQQRHPLQQHKQLTPDEEQQSAAIQAKKEEEAATKIQSVLRSFSARQRMKFREIERRFLIGMYEPVWRSKEYEEVFKRNLEKRRKYRDQRIRAYIQAIDDEKARVLRVVAPGLMEDIGDEIREWFRVWYKEVKQFDEIPPEEKGGTILVVRAETMMPKEFLDEVERKRRAKVKSGGTKAVREKEKKAKEKLKKIEADRKKKELERQKKVAAAKAAKRKKRKPGTYEYLDYDEPVVGQPLYLEGIQEHTNIWDLRNDFDNPLEKHYMDIITDKILLDNQYECRQIVDKMMRVELDVLNDALDEDRVRLTGKRRKKRKKPKNKKRPKGKKGKKDLTSKRDVEDLFQELVDNDIIRTYPKVSLDEYHGDFSYNNWEYRHMDFDPPAAILDVRQAVITNCIIPIGVETMKKPRSVLILGPEQSGKHTLANAIFNATRCVLFDLSPERIAGKYEGGKGMKMLVHLITKMSKILAPSIIYFDAAEKPFYKKVPKEEKPFNPKRIGKQIKKIVKSIKQQDRVLVLGVTNQPWRAQGTMKKVYEKHILVPRSGYNGVYMFWRELLMRYPGIDRNFNVTALTKIPCDKKFQIVQHCKTALHAGNKNKLKYGEKKQDSISECFQSTNLKSSEQEIFNHDLCEALLSSNIPLSKLSYEHLRKFLENHCKWNIPSERSLRKNEVDSVYSAVTKNYQLPVLKEALEHVLTPRRIIQLHFKPLVPEEVYEYFVETGVQPVTDKKWKKYQKWFNKTKWGKQKAKFNKWANAKRAAEEKKKKR